MNAKRLIAGLVAAVTLTLFVAAAGARQLGAPQQVAPQPAAEQNEDPADAFFDRIEEEKEKEGMEERLEEARERKEESMEEAKEKEGD